MKRVLGSVSVYPRRTKRHLATRSKRRLKFDSPERSPTRKPINDSPLGTSSLLGTPRKSPTSPGSSIYDSPELTIDESVEFPTQPSPPTPKRRTPPPPPPKQKARTPPPPPPKLKMTIIRKSPPAHLKNPKENVEITFDNKPRSPDAISASVSAALQKKEAQRKKRAQEKLRKKKKIAQKILDDAGGKADITLIETTRESNIYVQEHVLQLLRLLRHHSMRGRITKRDKKRFWKDAASDNVVDLINRLSNGKHQQIFFKHLRSMEDSIKAKKKSAAKKQMKQRIQKDFDGPSANQH